MDKYDYLNEEDDELLIDEDAEVCVNCKYFWHDNDNNMRCDKNETNMPEGCNQFKKGNKYFKD